MAIEFVDMEDLTRIPGSKLTGEGECMQVSATEKTTVADIAEFTLREMERTGRPVYILQGDYYGIYSGANNRIVTELMASDGGFENLKELTRHAALVMRFDNGAGRVMFSRQREYDGKIEWEFISCNEAGEPVHNRYVLNGYQIDKYETPFNESVVLPVAFAAFTEDTPSTEIDSTMLSVFGNGLYGVYDAIQKNLPFYLRADDYTQVRLLTVRTNDSFSEISYSFIYDSVFCQVWLYYRNGKWTCERLSKDLLM